LDGAENSLKIEDLKIVTDNGKKNSDFSISVRIIEM
jgi:hypothetical protein